MGRPAWRIRAARRADRALLLQLVGVAAHERVLFRHGQRQYVATKLHLVTIALAWQGQRFETFETGERVSDVVMVAVMTDVAQRVPRRDARVNDIVHEANVRSIRLCQRHGLIEELARPDPAYRRLVTGRRASKRWLLGD